MLGLVIEAIADAQKSAFKAKSENLASAFRSSTGIPLTKSSSRVMKTGPTITAKAAPCRKGTAKMNSPQQTSNLPK